MWPLILRGLTSLITVSVLAFAALPAVRAQSNDDLASLNAQVVTLYRAGQFVEATEVAKRALALAERRHGTDHPEVGKALGNLGDVLRQRGLFVEAENLQRRALAIAERHFGAAHTSTAQVKLALALVLQRQGRYAEAIGLAEQALAVLDAPTAAMPAELSVALNNLATLYETTGRLADAERLLRRSLSVTESARGGSHPEVGIRLNNLALLVERTGRLAEAETLARRALAITEAAAGPEHPDVAVRLSNLAGIISASGRPREAETLYLRAIAINEKTLGPEHPTTAVSLNNLGSLYRILGRLDEALPLAQRALAISEKALRTDHPDLAIRLDNVALLLKDAGRFVEAEALARRGLVIGERQLGPTHPTVALQLNNLAAIVESQGRLEEAETLYRRSLAATEGALGPSHRQTALRLNNLALVLQQRGRLADAEVAARRALAITEQALGPAHPETANRLNNLGGLLQSLGKFDDAEAAFGRSLRILEQALGTEHPESVILVANLGALAMATGQWPAAYAHFQRSSDLVRRRILRAPDFERAAMGVSQQLVLSGQFVGGLKAAFRIAQSAPREAQALTRSTFEAAQWALSSEAGASMALMAARSAVGDASLAPLVRERQDLATAWREAERQLVATLGQQVTGDTAAALRGQMAALDRRIAAIDADLVQRFPNYAEFAAQSPMPAEAVGATLHADEALVLFLDGPAFGQTPEETFVWIVTKAGITWRRSELGSAKLAQEVAALRCGLDGTAWNGEGAERCAKALGIPLDKAPVEGQALPFDTARAHKLYEALFGGVQDLVKGKHLLVVPSGPLSQLPFQVLVTKPPAGNDHRAAAWLARDHAITVLPAVSSLKALRRTGKPSAATKPMIGFGNPLLDGPDARYADRAQRARTVQRCPDVRPQQVAVVGSARSAATRVPTRGGLAVLDHLKIQVPLPETADELCAVAEEVKAEAGDIRLGAQATEREIKRLSTSGELAKFRMVHFATHGLLAGQLDGTSEPGLILTPPGTATAEDDGYLSASEIAALKLDADLVILSACNTAAGAATSAEALSGLARAFIYAQARALLVSHWEVYSDATVKLITAAVREMARDTKVGRAEAMRRSMIALIDKGAAYEAHPSYWAPFVIVGEGG
ncbi:MAG: tetratricopeptide repeat protein [Hyphomicrobiaceae bacterium]